MDKNSMIGMLLMCAVIFGFMWLNQPSEAELAEQRRQQDSIAAAQAQAEKSALAGAVIDTLADTELAQLKAIMRDMPGADTAGIRAEGVNLTLAGGQIQGTINVGDTTVDITEAVGTTTANPVAHNLAVAALKKAINIYARNGAFAGSLTGSEQIVTIKNDLLSVDISTQGANLVKAVLPKYKTFKSDKLVLFDKGDNQCNFTLSNNTQRFDTRNFFFTPEQENDSTVLMKLDLGNGATWGLRYTLVPDAYMLRMEIVQQGMNQVIPLNINTIDIDWQHHLSRHEEGKMFEERNSGIYYKYTGESSVENTKESGDDEDETKDKVKWIAAKNQFFSMALIADSTFVGGRFNSHAHKYGDAEYNDYLKVLNIHTTIPYSSDRENAGKFYIFMGPNSYKMLSSYDRFSPKEDLKLTRLIPLGWKLFRWVNTGIVIPLFDLLSRFISNYGIVILLLTIIIKIIISPLTFKSYMSQAKMRILAPDIAAINEKYPNQEDALKRQQKTMELYSLAGASPMSGCLPMLLQMPILIALFVFFPSCIDLRGQSFLWAHDLSAPDKIVEWTAQIPLVSSYFGNHLSLFCLLMTVTNLIYTYLTMQSQNQSNTMPGMKWMMYLMPLMFLVFFNNYASGLSYYYFLSLLITIAQTYLCRYLVKEDKVRAQIAANRAKPKKKGGFMARLEEAQRQQQAAMREQEKRNRKKGNKR